MGFGRMKGAGGATYVFLCHGEERCEGAARARGRGGVRRLRFVGVKRRSDGLLDLLSS